MCACLAVGMSVRMSACDCRCTYVLVYVCKYVRLCLSMYAYVCEYIAGP